MWGSLDSSYVLRRVLTGDLGDGPINWWTMTNLLFRLFQAHVILGSLFIFVIRDQFNGFNSSGGYHDLNSIRSHSGIWDVAWVLFCIDLVNLIPGVSIFSTIATMLFYDMYHHAGAVKRRNKSQAGIRPHSVSLKRFPWSLLDLCAIMSSIPFGIIPLYHAQFLHLFTSTLNYRVSIKTKRISAEVIKLFVTKLYKNRRKDSILSMYKL